MARKPKFDFEAIYKLYPRKEGKRLGIERLEREITTTEQYERFINATKNYATLCRLRATETKYILIFSTFTNGRWEDYESLDALSDGIGSKNKTLAEQVLAGEL